MSINFIKKSIYIEANFYIKNATINFGQAFEIFTEIEIFFFRFT